MLLRSNMHSLDWLSQDYFQLQAQGCGYSLAVALSSLYGARRRISLPRKLSCLKATAGINSIALLNFVMRVNNNNVKKNQLLGISIFIVYQLAKTGRNTFVKHTYHLEARQLFQEVILPDKLTF